MKIFRDDLPAATLRAHEILAAAYPVNCIHDHFHTDITESAEDVAALEFLQNLGAVEHFEGITFELTSAGELYRELVLLEIKESRTWADDAGDMWYETDQGYWTSYGPGQKKPANVPDVPPHLMRDAYPDHFPF